VAELLQQFQKGNSSWEIVSKGMLGGFRTSPSLGIYFVRTSFTLQENFWPFLLEFKSQLMYSDLQLTCCVLGQALSVWGVNIIN
jgi:hypothetical protein